MDNPFAENEHRLLHPPSTALVIFGATGDLTQRKLIPALYNLSHDGYLPSSFAVIGASRTPLTDDDFRDRCKESIASFSRRDIDPKVWERFSRNIYYQPLDGTKKEGFVALRERLESLGKERGEDLNYLYYLATSPRFFADISTRLGEQGLVADPHRELRRTALIIEKPFGHDLESARVLNETLNETFHENQIFRIDHYLGKETVQNILVFRFANGIFEPLWSREYIDHIQISVCESIGVGTRASYFDSSGIVRDIVQNHLLQILSLLCIEPPLSLHDADSIRDEKVKVLRSLKRFTDKKIEKNVIRAQYTRGYVDGKAVPGYLEEEGVASGSQTPSYVAMKFEIDNWRFAGVPIYVRVGKRLPKRITEISLHFKKAPRSIFQSSAQQRGSAPADNMLTIQVQPDEGISLCVNAKPPGPLLQTKPVMMDFLYDDSFATASPEAYERLLLDAMRGDATLFTRNDEIEEAWSLLDPILKSWEAQSGGPLTTYEAGTWGPAEASTLLNERKHRWRRL